MNLRQLLTAVTLTTFCLPTTALADDWMGRLDDNIYLHELSIPGSHDAATGHGFAGWMESFGESFARTQDKTLQEQWESGIRVFDLRPAFSDNDLIIYHGIISTTLSMREALSTICSLLEQHPSETAIVIMRHESDADGETDDWKQPMLDLLNDDVIHPFLIDFKADMTLGDVRGRLLLLSRDQYATKPIGGFITKWNHSTELSKQCCVNALTGPQSRTSVYVQDFYECTATGAKAQKTQTIKTLLNYSTNYKGNGHFWYINHTSGYTLTTSFFGSEVSSSDGYRDNAATQNAAVIEYLKTHTGPMGLVLMDFAGEDRSGDYDVMSLSMTKAIIENNFLSELRKAEPSRIADRESYNSPLHYYSLDGRSLGNQPVCKGIVIVRSDTETRKTIIR